MGVKLISFSLWGDKKSNLEYAVLNADLAKLYYPGWVCRFYIGEGVPYSTKMMLNYLQADLVEYVPEYGDWEAIGDNGAILAKQHTYTKRFERLNEIISHA